MQWLGGLAGVAVFYVDGRLRLPMAQTLNSGLSCPRLRAGFAGIGPVHVGGMLVDVRGFLLGFLNRMPCQLGGSGLDVFAAGARVDDDPGASATEWATTLVHIWCQRELWCRAACVSGFA